MCLRFWTRLTGRCWKRLVLSDPSLNFIGGRWWEWGITGRDNVLRQSKGNVMCLKLFYTVNEQMKGKWSHFWDTVDLGTQWTNSDTGASTPGTDYVIRTRVIYTYHILHTGTFSGRRCPMLSSLRWFPFHPCTLVNTHVTTSNLEVRSRNLQLLYWQWEHLGVGVQMGKEGWTSQRGKRVRSVRISS